jgi:signal transduction histidine kinase
MKNYFYINFEKYWLINLRWLAVIFLLFTPFILEKIFKVHIDPTTIYIISFFILTYNFIFFIIYKKLNLNKDVLDNKNVLFDNSQIILDIICLTLLLHFYGGIENLFVFYYIFHVIISSIILEKKYAFLQMTFIVFLFIAMALGEYSGLLKHYNIPNFINLSLYADSLFVTGMIIVFSSTMFISFYMASTISEKLRKREKELYEANRLLEVKDKIKNEYVLRVSHDIKGHIAAIQNCIYPIKDKYLGDLNDDQKNLLKRANVRCEKLMQFVKMLLNLTIIKLKQEDEKEKFNPIEVIKKAIDMVLPTAKSKNITIKSDFNLDNIMIIWNKPELNLVITELLTNAIKYTPEKGKIFLETKTKNNFFYIEIKDTGIGIPEIEKKNIFNEFFRATNAKEIEPISSGLGLAMVKQIIDKNNSEIEVDSELNKGTAFIIKIKYT